MMQSRGEHTVSGPVLSTSSHESWPRAWHRRATLKAGACVLAGLSRYADAVHRAAEAVGLPPPEDADAAQRIASWHDGQDWPERGLCVAIGDASGWSEEIIAAPGVTPVEWVRVRGRVVGSGRPSHADAWIDGTRDGSLRVSTAEHAEREAAWYDWGAPRPLSYASVFPSRLDPARVTIDLSEGGCWPEVVRLLVEASALMSREAWRLDLSDRLAGRRPLDFADANSPAAGMLRIIMGRVAHLLPGAQPSPIVRTAARVLSAWAATAPEGTGEDDRRSAAEAAAAACPDEPEVLLRLASVRFGCLSDAEGHLAIQGAARLLRGREVLPASDPGAFLLAELSTSPPSPWTTGRLAAGVCLVLGAATHQRLSFLSDDLMDDLRHSPVLLGRDADHRLILEVMRATEHTRRANERGLPPPTPPKDAATRAA